MNGKQKIYGGSSKVNILLSAGFQKFTKETVELYRGYLDQMNGATGSYMRVANILTWHFYSIPYYLEKDGFFLILNDDAYYGGFTVYMPVGDYQNTSGLHNCIIFLQALLREMGETVEFLEGKEWMAPYLQRIKGISFVWTYEEAESDYLYAFQDLESSMSRRHVYYDRKLCRFEKNYEPVVSDYTPADYDACVRLIEEMYCTGGTCENCVFGCIKASLEAEIDALCRMRGHFLTIKSKGTLLAYIILCEDNEDLLYLDRKSPHTIEGLTEYITALLVERFGDTYEIMNYEEDMGREGLRIHKRNLGPHVLSHNYHITIKD